MNAPKATPPALLREDRSTSGAVKRRPESMLDAMSDGFQMLSLLRRAGRLSATDGSLLQERVKDFLKELERDAKALNVAPEDVSACQYAFCALADEIVLQSDYAGARAWQKHPLQLQLFGSQLAGLEFFERLEALRRQGADRLQALEVFHMCLLLGFVGRYVLNGKEELGFLTSRLGTEIAHLKGASTGFAPHAIAGDSVVNRLRHEVRPWVVCIVFALTASIAYAGLDWRLGVYTRERVASYAGTVKVIPLAASVTITLP